MSFVIWRDSVAMGDDVDAPHERVVPLEDHASIGAVVEAMLRTPYLASIVGGRATWIVEGARPLAVVAQQWAAPRWLVAPELPATALRRSGGRRTSRCGIGVRSIPNGSTSACERARRCRTATVGDRAVRAPDAVAVGASSCRYWQLKIGVRHQGDSKDKEPRVALGSPRPAR